MSKYKNEPPIIIQNHKGLSNDMTVIAGITLNGSFGTIKENKPISIIPIIASAINPIFFIFHLLFYFNIKKMKVQILNAAHILNVLG